MIELKELQTKQEMLDHLEVMQELYPSLTRESYSKDLDEMLLNNHYGQLAAFDNGKCIGIAGFWIGTKLWCGRYLEIDNLVVSDKARSKGVGKALFEYLSQKAIEFNCNMMSLDSYTYNFKAHKFFYNEGYAPRGFHFIRFLNEDQIR
jgi:GNAT superfamily N-acetyltransferase